MILIISLLLREAICNPFIIVITHHKLINMINDFVIVNNVYYQYYAFLLLLKGTGPG